jgi:hypothetical protein
MRLQISLSFHSKVQKKNPLPAVTIRADLGHHIAAGIDNARLSCSLQFGVEESSFSGSKVEFEAAWFDLLIDAVESLTERGGGSRGGVENIGKLGAQESCMGAGEEQCDA